MNQTPPRYKFFMCPILMLQKDNFKKTVAIHFIFSIIAALFYIANQNTCNSSKLGFKWQQVRNHIHENQGAIHSSN